VLVGRLEHERASLKSGLESCNQDKKRRKNIILGSGADETVRIRFLHLLVLVVYGKIKYIRKGKHFLQANFTENAQFHLQCFESFVSMKTTKKLIRLILRSFVSSTKPVRKYTAFERTRKICHAVNQQWRVEDF